ncbi:V-set and immunoglobulin domain-containing protein 8 [Gopherus flavomarginatus]|uniref:V-set and immunoglobulin domain-containing protein 8 n=1 Tax=Gopherus flavomarginatus TaxID=286002 RepID=UPI0021CC0B4F|nr:V-set and immunoglobulin domain-containing protein 8 [Gopherus flavomarginatus]
MFPHSDTALLEAVRISAKGQQVLYLAQGDSVRLGCPYILEPQDNGPSNLDIIWTMVNPEQRLPVSLSPTPHPTSLFLTYQDQKIRYGSVPGLQQRVSFVAQDPSLYDASIHLANLQVSDSATYECRVRKATVDTHLITITVLEKPAAPRCWMDGEPVRGGNLMLRCCSDGGSLPLSYQWSKMGGDYAMGWLPPRTVQGQGSGDLMIQSLSQEHSGTYCCRVTNRVGYTQCMVHVSVPRVGYTGSRNVGLIVGSVLGAIFLLILLLSILWALLWYCRRRHCQPVVPIEIR